jgi:hypothetical protein
MIDGAMIAEYAACQLSRRTAAIAGASAAEPGRISITWTG